MPNVNRYSFDNIFHINPGSGFISPRFNIYISGNLYRAGSIIPPGLNFGGINLYSFIGKDVAGTWDDKTRTLTFAGFYK